MCASRLFFGRMLSGLPTAGEQKVLSCPRPERRVVGQRKVQGVAQIGISRIGNITVCEPCDGCVILPATDTHKPRAVKQIAMYHGNYAQMSRAGLYDVQISHGILPFGVFGDRCNILMISLICKDYSTYFFIPMCFINL